MAEVSPLVKEVISTMRHCWGGDGTASCQFYASRIEGKDGAFSKKLRDDDPAGGLSLPVQAIFAIPLLRCVARKLRGSLCSILQVIKKGFAYFLTL